jgi:hypothetical protein
MKKEKRDKRKKEKPELPWQSGKYHRTQEYRFHLPYNFLLLCGLWQVTPQTVLLDFMDNISFGSWKREGRDKAKEHVAEYVLAMGYGQEFYSPDDIRTMFKQLDAMGMLFPKSGCDMELLDAHVAWRNKFQTAWFNEWFNKVRRNINDLTDTGV